MVNAKCDKILYNNFQFPFSLCLSLTVSLLFFFVSFLHFKLNMAPKWNVLLCFLAFLFLCFSFFWEFVNANLCFSNIQLNFHKNHPVNCSFSSSCFLLLVFSFVNIRYIIICMYVCISITGYHISLDIKHVNSYATTEAFIYRLNEKQNKKKIKREILNKKPFEKYSKNTRPFLHLYIWTTLLLITKINIV